MVRAIGWSDGLVFILSVLILGVCLGNLQFAGKRRSFAQFSCKKLDKKEESRTERRLPFSCVSCMQPHHALRHFGTASPGSCRGGGRIGGWLEVDGWRHACSGEEERRGGREARIGCGMKLQVCTPPSLFLI